MGKASRDKEPNVTCEVCGRQFWVKPCMAASRRFCSSRCCGRQRAKSDIEKREYEIGRLDKYAAATAARRASLLWGEMDCEWRVVPGFSRYEVSEYGDLRTARASRTRRAGHIVAGHLCGRGKEYRAFKIVGDDGNKHLVWSHRLVAIAFIGPPPSDIHQVAHGDGNGHNNHRSNLRWATPAENAADTVKHGRSFFVGASNPKAKLTEEQVRAIRDEYVPKYGAQKRLMEKYGLGRTALRAIITGEHWRYVR